MQTSVSPVSIWAVSTKHQKLPQKNSIKNRSLTIMDYISAKRSLHESMLLKSIAYLFGLSIKIPKIMILMRQIHVSHTEALCEMLFLPSLRVSDFAARTRFTATSRATMFQALVQDIFGRNKTGFKLMHRLQAEACSCKSF